MNTDETKTQDGEPHGAPETAPVNNPPEAPAQAAASTPSPSPAGADDSQDANDPPPPQAAAVKRPRDDDEELPGDNVGNRLPGARVPDDIGNRRKGGGGPSGGGGRDPHGRDQHGRGPQQGQGRGGQQHQQGRPQQPPARPVSQANQASQPASANASSSASGSASGEGEAPKAAVTEGGEHAGHAADGEHASGAEHGGSEHAPSTHGEGEGATTEASGASGASDGSGAPGDKPHAGEGGDTPAKKRRRRRRKKHGAGAAGAAAQADGTPAEGAEGQGEDGEDGEHAEGEDEELGPSAEGAEGQPAEGGGGEGKRRRGPRPPIADRDRPAFSIGEEVFGKVSKVTDTAVWIDIAGKATGLFDRRELVDDEPPVDGDQFIATVASTGVRGGMLMLSRLPIILEESRKVLEAAAQSGEIVNGFVTGAVKGGLEVDLGGLRAFAPASHVDLRHGSDLSHLVGQRLDFSVTQYAKKGRDVVVSRRKMLEEEHKKARSESLAQVQPGSVHRAVVRKVVAWGVFMALPDAGGVEGLVHMTEASHDRGARLNELFKPGAELEVKVLNIDDKGKLWLSRKAVVPDPWEAVKEKYTVGSRHKGKVARLQPFGAFIELEPGVDGLIHTGDLTMKAIEHPQEVVKVGDEIEVVVASCDPHAHKIGLHPAPTPGEESEPRQRVQPHKILKVAVVQATEAGLIVRVLGVTGRSARGFIPAGHTGTPRGSDLRKEFPVGKELEAKVIELDPRRGEAKLSIRAVKEDAEKQAYQQYRAGVARDAKFGTFADLMKKGS